MLFPLVYLLMLGNAMNRPLRDVPLAVVDEAGNADSAACRRGVLALDTGRSLVDAVFVADRDEALSGLRRGRYRGVWMLPFGLSPSGPAPSFIGDNTDRFSFDALEQALRADLGGGLRATEADRRRRPACASRRIPTWTT